MANSTLGVMLGLPIYKPACRHGGKYKVLGHCTYSTAPVRRRVVLCTPYGALIRSTYSDPVDGSYEFLGVAKGTYLVLGIDTSHVDRGVIYSTVEAIPM